MTLAEKIKKYREENNVSMPDLSRATGISKENLYKWEKGTKPTDFEAVRKLQNILESNWKDLQIELIRNGDQTLNTVSENPETYIQKRRNLKIDSSTSFKVPLVSVKARAGYVNDYDNIDLINNLDKYAIPPGVSHIGAIWRYFEVDGDSMEPQLSSGDYILCSQVPQEDWENVKDFYVYVIVTETNLLIKRIFVKSEKEWVLISDNETHTPQKLFDVTTLKELWVFRRLIKKTISPKKEFKIKI
jgi:phage repressor protein C with HTH and peptisase S24 domain